MRECVFCESADKLASHSPKQRMLYACLSPSALLTIGQTIGQTVSCAHSADKHAESKPRNADVHHADKQHPHAEMHTLQSKDVPTLISESMGIKRD